MYLFSAAFARAHFQYDSHPRYYFRFWSINALSASKVAELGSWELLVVPRLDLPGVDLPPDLVSSLLLEDRPLLPDFFDGDAFDLFLVPRNVVLLLVLSLLVLFFPFST